MDDMPAARPSGRDLLVRQEASENFELARHLIDGDVRQTRMKPVGMSGTGRCAERNGQNHKTEDGADHH